MLPRTISVQKKRGQTPLEALDALRAGRPELATVPLAYAGRLDPMASGTLLVLVGEECKKQKQYHDLDKEYETEILLGVSTDTGDALGMPTIAPQHTVQKAITFEQVKAVLPTLIGSHELPYPAFSSKVVEGIPLFERSLDGSIESVSIPTHIETVHSLSLLGLKMYSTKELEDRIVKDLAVVPRSDDPRKARGADFRQDAIRTAWNTLFAEVSHAFPSGTAPQWTVVRLRATVASGTYIRTLATRLAERLSTSGIALSIHRTKVGRYFPLISKIGIGVWTKLF